MNLSLLILFLILFSIINFSSPISALNPKFTACNRTFHCGNLTNITYPFYDGKTRPDYCGYPGLKLDCNKGSPQISISSQLYNLLSINKTANTIQVSVKNFNSTNACPYNLRNTTIDYSIFKFSPADQNITFYGCDQVLTGLPVKTECESLESGLTGYYMTSAMLMMYNGPGFFGICKSAVMPILQSAAKVIDKSQSRIAIVNAFEAGFELGLIVGSESSCDMCVGSGGACGFNSTSHRFVCYCPQSHADFNLKCEVHHPLANNTGNDTTGASPVGHHNNITPLVIGASIGALFLAAFVLGGWCLFLHNRRRLQIAQEKASRNPISSSSANIVLPVPAQGSSGANSSQAYTSTSSNTYSRSISSYTSSRPEDELANAYFGVPIFDYSELQQATNNFHESRLLGSGGYGSVYYGQLQDGRQVAVKRLYEKSFRRMEQFMNEIEIFARLRHKNLVTLYGCTSTKSRVLVLVYEYVPNGTVADHLHGKHAQTAFLEWPIRLSIAVETAEALAYLHKLDVIHRDVKTTNILLDNDFHVKVADFGLSRLFPNDATHVSTYPQGTPGYVDPEYYSCFRLTEKSDVYSFGVMLIEIISSLQAVDGSRNTNHVNLATMALDRIQNRALHELVDQRIGFERDPEVQRMVKMVAELGFRCLQHDKDMRPTMEEVVTGLRGIQTLEVRSPKQEGIVVVGCGDEVVLLKSMTT